jgi:HSP20 family molecular chaperone IbpA
MAHLHIVPYLEESFRPINWLDIDLWDGRRRDPLESLSRELALLRKQAHEDGLNSVCKKRKDAFEVDLDVHGFSPSDLNVSIKDDFLTVEGKHEERSEDGSSFSSRQFKRSFRIPGNVQVDRFKSKLAKDGRTLKIEAPLVVPQNNNQVDETKEVPIAINFTKSATNAA